MSPLNSMRLPTSYYSVCQTLGSHMLRTELRWPSRSAPLLKPRSMEKEKEPKRTVYDAWLASREIPSQKGIYTVAGAQRQVNLANARLAYCIIQSCASDFVRFLFFFYDVLFADRAQFKVLFELNPVRTTLMMSLNLVRSLFPAFRGYSQVIYTLALL
jgi:hypothetical protein